MIDPAGKLIQYMTQKNYQIDREPGQLNIIYIEGINPDFSLNKDALDGWNDLSIILSFDAAALPSILFSAVCTTEPGKAATFDSEARRLGGVARIAFGQHHAWRVGFHRRAKLLDTHPALVQCAPIQVHRDSNRDGKRTGDPMGFAYGLNQHGTAPNYKGGAIGTWSRGCLVRRWWNDHLRFMDLIKTDPRYIQNQRFIFSSTIIAGDDFFRNFESENEMKAAAT